MSAEQVIEKTVSVCRHFWTVSSWRLSDHSKTAQELICQNCGQMVDHAGLDYLRRNHVMQLGEPSH